MSLPSSQNSAIVLLRGNVLINGSSAMNRQGQIAILSPSGETVLLQAKEESLLVALSGKPLNEPVASYGPFVMNTESELQQAFQDYRAGLMGHVR